MDVRKEAKKRAQAKYEEFGARGEEFYLAHFRESLFDEFEDLERDARMVLVDWATDIVDREMTAPRKVNRTKRLPGVQWDVDGFYPLGDGRRIAKGAARMAHLVLHLQISDANARAVNKANIEEHEEFEMLHPFLDQGLSKTEAIAAYQRANPEG